MLTRITVLMIFLASWVALPALAGPGDDEFTVTYRFEIQQTSAAGQSGHLLINVMNIGDRAIKDLSVWVPDGANPALPHLPIMIGDLDAGFAREVLELFDAPNLPKSDEPETAAMWRIEFTDADGEQQQLDVVGQIGI